MLLLFADEMPVPLIGQSLALARLHPLVQWGGPHSRMVSLSDNTELIPDREYTSLSKQALLSRGHLI